MQVPRRLVPELSAPVLVNGVAKRLKRIILDTAKDRGSEVIELEVMSDHVHLSMVGQESRRDPGIKIRALLERAGKWRSVR